MKKIDWKNIDLNKVINITISAALGAFVLLMCISTWVSVGKESLNPFFGWLAGIELVVGAVGTYVFYKWLDKKCTKKSDSSWGVKDYHDYKEDDEQREDHKVEE